MRKRAAGIACFWLLAVVLNDTGWAAMVYRSVGYGQTAALRNGSTAPTITLRVNSGEAIFGAALPDNIGIGDCLVFDSDNNASLDSMAVICRRNDAQAYEVCNPDGEDCEVNMPGTTLVWRIHRAYISLNDAACGLENPGLSDYPGWNFDAWSSNHNLTSPATGPWNLACYADAPNTNTANFSGWVTNMASPLVIFAPHDTGADGEVGVSQRHDGKWNNDAFTLVAKDDEGLRLPAFVRVVGLQFQCPAGDHSVTALCGDYSVYTDIEVSKCIFRGPGGGTNDSFRGIEFENTQSGIVKIWNNVFYDFTTGAEGNMAIFATSTVTGFNLYCYHNTIVNCENGIYMWNQALAYAKNCMVLDIRPIDGYSYFGVTSTASVSNLSNDGILPPGAGSRNGTPLFANAAAGDFHLAAADTQACNRGTSLSGDPYLYIDDDIDGQLRGSYAGWDIGADELAMQPTPTFTVSPTVSPTPTQTPTPQPTASAPDPAAEIAYPNPAQGGMVTFTCRPGAGERITVRVFTAAYRQVWSTTLQGVPNQINRVEWNVNSLPPGIYLYRIETGSRKSAFKKLAVIK